MQTHFSTKPHHDAALKVHGFQKKPACHECEVSVLLNSHVTVTPPGKVDEEEDGRQHAGSVSCQRLSVAQLATVCQIVVLYSATQSLARFQRFFVQRKKQPSRPIQAAALESSPAGICKFLLRCHRLLLLPSSHLAICNGQDLQIGG